MHSLMYFLMVSGYDGGDCCQCTCKSTDRFSCGDGSNGGYACLDPNATCVDDDDGDMTANAAYLTYGDSEITTTNLCATAWLSDGLCDLQNNNEDCGESLSAAN